MKIAGLAKTTLLDYPGQVAATIFTHGCNFRCPFCYNRDLVVGCFADDKLIKEKDVFDFLVKRKNVLAGICITGGEPTLQPDLTDFIRKAKDLGYLVKLDTNGYRPDIIINLLSENLLDYIAMDVKSSIGKYSLLTGINDMDKGKIEDSIEIIKSSGINHEFRTTIINELHTIDDLLAIGKLINGSAWYLQPFIESDNIIKKGFTSYSKIKISEITKILINHGYQVKVRAN